MHFLYTRQYQLGNPGCPTNEFEHSLMVYCFARRWNLPELAVLAKKKVEDVSTVVSISDAFAAIRKAYSSIEDPAQEPWLSELLMKHTHHALHCKPNIFSVPENQIFIDRTQNFDRSLIIVLANLYNKHAAIHDGTLSSSPDTIELMATRPSTSRSTTASIITSRTEEIDECDCRDEMWRFISPCCRRTMENRSHRATG